MRAFGIRSATTLFGGLAALAGAGCCSKPGCKPASVVKTNACGPSISELTAIPPNAKEGECYAKIYIPPVYKNVTEKVLVREASERLEPVPAEYEWIEEKVVTKEASSEIRTMPAEFGERDRTIETSPARTDWEVKKSSGCDELRDQQSKDVYCLVKRPAEQTTVHEKYQVKPARTEEQSIPAEYQTIRKQRLVHPAGTKRVDIPAEYDEVQRRVKVCDARIVWKRIPCEESEYYSGTDQPAPRTGSTPAPAADKGEIKEKPEEKSSTQQPWWSTAGSSESGKTLVLSPETINAVKNALRQRGYKPGPNNGEIRARDLAAIGKFQSDHNLPVGDLNEPTMRALNVGAR